ncbi:PEP-CTERM sorting domain-containing protein [Rhodoferax sp. U11-2br]|nr:PEP-CTERM sorting domain-containing protein [Rhodoferax sp. U11-2br]MBT3069124.1 PEP-CTERM sorting domain-containing protein [Rhodoferax sp. U11-2br]
MNALIRKVALVSAFLITLPAAQAAIQNYSFSGLIDSGAYIGQTFSGSFSFDDATLTNLSDEWIPVNQMTMSFLGNNYTLAEASGTVEVNYNYGTFLGLSYSAGTTTEGFTLITGYSNISEAYLAYDTQLGDSGAGSVIYAPVPEPETYALLLAGLALMSGIARRRKLNQTNH